MAYNKLSTYKTKIAKTSSQISGCVRYHSTNIVLWGNGFIKLQSNGWQGVTTKRKMNQASQQFGLGFSVWQKNFTWFVCLPNGETVEYEDGMSFQRAAQ